MLQVRSTWINHKLSIRTLGLSTHSKKVHTVLLFIVWKDPFGDETNKYVVILLITTYGSLPNYFPEVREK